MMKFLHFFFALTVLFISGVNAFAQEVSSPVTVPLVTETYTKDGSTYEKLGIWVSLAGSDSPELFELDTGGVGFYAAYTSNSAWWGTNFTRNGLPASNQYTSGNTYLGNQVTSSITLFSNSTSASAAISSYNNIVVGQSTNIVTSTSDWPTTTNPPVDTYFYGDFGLNLSTNSDNVLNPLAQLTYANGVLPGYIITVGAYGQTNGASIQIGLTASDIANFATKGSVFAMQGTSSNSFFPNNTNIPTLTNGQIISGSLQIGTNSYTNVGVNLDTGTPTPKIHSDEISMSLATNGSDINSGLSFDLSATNTNGTTSSIFSLASTGGSYGSNQIALDSSAGNYVTVGILPFYGNSVMYDLSDSTVGIMTSIPEPSTYALLALGVFAMGIAYRHRGV